MTAQVISNPHRDRLYKQELSEQGIDFTVWPAIFDKTPLMGVSKAHKQIIQWAKDNNQDEVLIMEDDIRFTDPNSFKYYLSKKPETFNIYFAGVYRGTIENGLVKYFSGMHCYIVHKNFYDVFLSADENKDIDNWLSEQPYDYHICYPMAAIQHNGYSDLNRGFCNYDDLLEGKELYKRKAEDPTPDRINDV